MHHTLNPRTHGYLDYLGVLFFFVAPSLFGFDEKVANLSYIIAVAYLAMVLLTAYPLGLMKWIPFPIHGGVELALGAFLVASPWLLRFSQAPMERNVMLITGLAILGVWFLTDYRAAGHSGMAHPA